MTKMSNLPRELLEEILSRVPVTSLRRVRLTCKKWNTLSKDLSFSKKHLGQVKVAAAREREFFVVMMKNLKVYLLRVNLYNNVESCIKCEGQVSLEGLDNQINLLQIFHCDGLLLWVIKDNIKLVVWNPYRGQTRLIEPIHNYHKEKIMSYALGYEEISKSFRNYKILGFIELDSTALFEYKIYDFNSDSWSVLDVTLDWYLSICYDHDLGVSLDGNTYWFASEYTLEPTVFLLCFDFTRETFGPHLPVPFQNCYREVVTLSSVRNEQLGVLIQNWDKLHMEIWITNKIEPNAVSWNSKFFLAMNMGLHTSFKFPVKSASFFINEEKKVVVFFDKNKKGLKNHTCNVAYIVGVDGYLKEVDLGESSHQHCFPLVCSYVPSLVQLN